MHKHRWALTHITDGTAHFVCTAPACQANDFTAPADTYLAALAAQDARVPGPWPPDPPGGRVSIAAVLALLYAALAPPDPEPISDAR